MALYNGPARGGTRGGQDQFNWDDVKIDKDRENYLGHSVKAPVGRWQKGKDLTWYNKDSRSVAITKSQQLKAERDAVKRQEEEAMAIALGLKKGTIQKPKEALSKQDIVEATRRGSEGDSEPVVDRPKGVGYGSYRMSLATPVAETSTLPGTSCKDPKPDEKDENSKRSSDPVCKTREEDQKAKEGSSKKEHKKEKKHKKQKRERKRRHQGESVSDEESEGRSREKRSKKDKGYKHKHSRKHRHHSRSE